MATVSAPRRSERAADDARCSRCAQLGRSCPSCTQRRRVAWRLVDDQGHSIEQAAARLNVPPAQVRELVDQERDRRELEKYRLDSIPVSRARAFLERELARDPWLTRAEVAHRMSIRQADFDRSFGYAPAKHGAMQTRVGIATASRLVRALGRAPHELDGC
jgi:plasmid maintenance system antidote protein VapI